MDQEQQLARQHSEQLEQMDDNEIEALERMSKFYTMYAKRVPMLRQVQERIKYTNGHEFVGATIFMYMFSHYDGTSIKPQRYEPMITRLIEEWDDFTQEIIEMGKFDPTQSHSFEFSEKVRYFLRNERDYDDDNGSDSHWVDSLFGPSFCKCMCSSIFVLICLKIAGYTFNEVQFCIMDGHVYLCHPGKRSYIESTSWGRDCPSDDTSVQMPIQGASTNDERSILMELLSNYSKIIYRPDAEPLKDSVRLMRGLADALIRKINTEQGSYPYIYFDYYRFFYSKKELQDINPNITRDVLTKTIKFVKEFLHEYPGRLCSHAKFLERLFWHCEVFSRDDNDFELLFKDFIFHMKTYLFDNLDLITKKCHYYNNENYDNVKRLVTEFLYVYDEFYTRISFLNKPDILKMSFREFNHT